MRVAMLSWRDQNHPDAGGAEVCTWEICRRLAARGHEVTWFSARYNRAADHVAERVDFRYGGRGAGVYAAGLAWALRHRDYDVYVDQINGLGFGLPLVPGLRRRTVALVHQTIDDIWETYPLVTEKIGKWSESRFLSLYRRTPFVAAGPSTVEDLRARGWQGPGVPMPPGSDHCVVGSLAPKTTEPSVCFLGRLNAPTKRLDLALSIVREARRFIPSLTLHVVGRGDVPSGIDGEEQWIVLHQNASNDERSRVLSQSWALIATSIREGWGLMVVEAGLHGTPSAVLAVPGLRDAVVPGRTGIYLDDDPQTAGRQVADLVSNHGQLDALASAAVDHARSMTWDGATDTFENQIKAVAAAFARTRCAVGKVTV